MIIDAEDDRGMMRRRLLPDSAVFVDPNEGLPIDFYDSILAHYHDAPEPFLIALCNALYHTGLVEAQDFLANDAATRFRRAMQATIKHDAFDIIELARKEHANGRKP